MSQFDWSNVLSFNGSALPLRGGFLGKNIVIPKRRCLPRRPESRCGSGWCIQEGIHAQHAFTVFGHDWCRVHGSMRRSMGWNQDGRRGSDPAGGIGSGPRREYSDNGRRGLQGSGRLSLPHARRGSCSAVDCGASSGLRENPSCAGINRIGLGPEPCLGDEHVASDADLCKVQANDAPICATMRQTIRNLVGARGRSRLSLLVAVRR